MLEKQIHHKLAGVSSGKIGSEEHLQQVGSHESN